MKILNLTFLIALTNFHSLAFAEIPLALEKCKELAVDLSIGEFSPDRAGNSVVYDKLGLNNKTGYKYIDDSRVGLNERLQKHCSSGAPTLETFRKTHHAECSQVCQENAELNFKKPLFGENNKKMDADTACLIVCNRASSKLDAMAKGAGLAQKTSHDCSGQITNGQRSKKPTLFDGVMDIERSFHDKNRAK